MADKRRILLSLGMVVLVPIIIIITLWVSLLFSRDVLNHPLAARAPWPIVCSTRGCVTTTAWQKHYRVRIAFAETAEQQPPTSIEALTTLTRQHLVKHAVLRQLLTPGDAAKFRQEILNAESEKQVLDVTSLSLKEYDKLVLLPMLRQEILRQQRRAESFDELFKLLASERAVFALPRGIAWDSDQAAIVSSL